MTTEPQLPQNIEAELGVLGSLLIDPEALDLITDRLTSDDFYRDAHRTIYQAIEALSARRIHADFITLCDELERINKLEEVGGSGYLTSLINQVPTSANVTYYADIVARTGLNRRLIHTAGRIAALGYEQEENSLEEAERFIFELGRHRTSSDFSTAASIVNDVLSNLLNLQHSEERSVIGVPTGFVDIDACLGGMQRSDLLILAARPAMGKSSLMLSIAHNAVFQHNQRVGIFSLEMSKAQLIQRLLSFETHIPLFRLRNGRIEDSEWARLEEAGMRLQTDRLHIDDTGGITLTTLRSKARRLMAHSGLDLIIVDYLQLMHASVEKNRNREQEVAQISAGLKEVAKELDIPVLALAQINRAVESRQSKIPQLSDLRESGAIENDADVVMFIYRDDFYAGVDEEGRSLSERPGIADIIIAKHRNGPSGNVSLRFNAHETSFTDVVDSAILRADSQYMDGSSSEDSQEDL